jgi:TolB protein
MTIRLIKFTAGIVSLLAGLSFGLAGCNRAPTSNTELPAGSPTTGIVFVSTRDGNEELYRLQADGSGIIRLTNNEAVDSEPAWSPAGTQIAYRSRQDGSSDIFIMDPDGHQRVNLLNDPADSFDDEFNPQWHPDGDRLAIYTDRAPPTGCTAHTLAQMTLLDGPAGIAKAPTSAESYTWSPDGQSLLAVTRCISPQGAFYTWDPEIDRVSRFTPAVDLPFPGHPAYSPDGRFLAFQATVAENTDIYLLDIASGEIQQLTTHPAKDTKPTWSPDGREMAFVTGRDGNDEIYIMSRDGDNKRNLTNHPARDDWPHWSPSTGQ